MNTILKALHKKSALLIAVVLLVGSLSANAQIGLPNDHPRVLDEPQETPIDNHIWLGLVAGVLIGGVMYYRRQKKIA